MIHEVEMLEAPEFACEYYNIPRQEFVEKAALRYPLPARHTPLFLCAIRTYDEIQKDMMEVA